MKVVIGADHGGVDLKEEIKKYLDANGYEYHDVGTFSHEAVDYPDIGQAAAEYLMAGKADLGIVICGTGIGISISANKVPGVRCALLSDVFSAKRTREHNNANMMALGARVIGPGLAIELVDAFLHTDFLKDEPRHVKRVEKISQIEKKYCREDA